jgi:AcrR family transcriptional regulator
MPRLTREESRSVTRSRLLDAAAAVFAEKGFHGASLDEIAERAGYSRGAVYSNFADKDELFLALIDQRNEQAIREISELLKADRSPDAFIQSLMRRHSERAGDARARFLLTSEFRLYAIRNRKVRTKLAKRLEFERGAIGQAVTALFGDLGVGLPAPINDVAAVVMAIEDGLAIQRAIDSEAVPATLYYETLTLLLRALAALQTTPQG